MSLQQAISNIVNYDQRRKMEQWVSSHPTATLDQFHTELRQIQNVARQNYREKRRVVQTEVDLVVKGL